MPRVRAVPHVVGNFHTLVYIRVRLDGQVLACARRAADLLWHLCRMSSPEGTRLDQVPECSSESDDDVVGALDGEGRSKSKKDYVHLSLCKPMYLKRHFTKPFLDRLQEAISNVKPFYLVLDKAIALFSNEDNTGFFAALPVEKACKMRSVLPLIDIVDEVADIFGYEKYYQQRQPHVSLAATGWDLKRVMDDLYCGSLQFDGAEYSSHHWTQVETVLSHFNQREKELLEGHLNRVEQEVALEYDGKTGKSLNNNLDDYEIEYTFCDGSPFPPNVDVNEDDDTVLCIYVESICVLIGAQETIIELVK
ncbi:hypothetical protein BgAZ_306330 [Babesia gibsoni]|uniref:U6 snRNA phosphodiesterase 1 n=1 Tax=Babesia gibsoni TaxID=33632 RepID=A0AAD8P934_BABGI|nr:hypothetical protein BgAZ_306330 [Babesia gibsoni]